LAEDNPATSKKISDSDDPYVHHYLGFLCDDVALTGALVNGRTGTTDQVCPSNRQDHLPDQNDLYAHDA
jgi:hypothetical protein